MRDGQVVGTKTSTGNALLIDARFELPYGKFKSFTQLNSEIERKYEIAKNIATSYSRTCNQYWQTSNAL